MSEKPSVVFDTQVLLRAVVNRKSLPAKIIFDHPQVRKKFELTDAEVQPFLEHLAKEERVIVEDVPAISRDPKDDIFLACAVTGNADYLVSEDKDLLILNPHENIPIVDVQTFWNVLQTG